MDFFDMPFGSSHGDRRGNRYSGDSAGRRSRRNNNYSVEEIDTVNNDQESFYGNRYIDSGIDSNTKSGSRASTTSSTPRVDEPENDFNDIGVSNFSGYPRRTSLSSALMLDHFDDEFDDDFFGGFGSMFGSMRRHMDRMNQTFSSAFDEIGNMSMNNNGNQNGNGTRVYCSSTCETILPNGVREVKHTSRDSATGKQTSYHSRQIGDKQVVEHSRKDLRSGVEQRERNLLNVNDGEIDNFDRIWQEYGLRGNITKSLK